MFYIFSAKSLDSQSYLHDALYLSSKTNVSFIILAIVRSEFAGISMLLFYVNYFIFVNVLWIFGPMNG